MSEMRKLSELYENELSLAIYGTTCEVDDLKESISQHGLLDPLVVTEDGALISGHRRLLALRELGWEEAPCIVVKPKDKREEEILVIEYNRSRHKTTGQLRREGERLKELIGKEGMARRLSVLKNSLLSQKNETSLVKIKNSKTSGTSRISARDVVASQLGMSPAKWGQIEYINKYGKLGIPEIDEIIQKLDNDEITVGAAHKLIRLRVKAMERENKAKAREQGILGAKTKTVAEEEHEFNYMSALRCEKLCDEICSILEPIFRIDDRTFNPVPWDTSYSSIERAIEMLREIDAKTERHAKYYNSHLEEVLKQAGREEESGGE